MSALAKHLDRLADRKARAYEKAKRSSDARDWTYYRKLLLLLLL